MTNGLLWYISPVINITEHVPTIYMICGEKSLLLSEYIDLSSWTKLLEAAQIRKYENFICSCQGK